MNTTTTETTTTETETACLIRLETRSQNLRRAGLESELAHAADEDEARAVRREIGRCDRALMELGAGRLPR